MTNQQTTEPTDSTTYRMIKEVLDSWSDTQINLASDSARVLLALAIHERVDSQIKQLIEDIICGSEFPDRVW